MITEKKYVLAKQHVHNEACIDHHGDQNCGFSGHSLQYRLYDPQLLLAEFFQIDHDKIDREKMQMIEELREGSA